jgi:hypothetical protein
MRYVEIHGNRVSGPFDYEGMMPTHDSLLTVDVTNMTPEPKSAWIYEGGVFTPASRILSEVSIEDLRESRNLLLELSDWRVMPHTPLPEAEVLLWADYRQELRDITEGYTPIAAPVWPVAPS